MFRKTALLFALALLAAACGTDTSGDDAATEIAGEAAPSVTTAQAADAATGEAEPPSEGEHADDATDHDDGTADDDTEEGTRDEGAGGHDDDAAPDDQAATGDVDRMVEVSMTDLAFSPDDLNVTAGETITFRVSNDGNLVHEFRLSNAHRIEEHIAEGHQGHGDENGGHHGDVDVTLELAAGDSGELTVTFPEDATLFTEIACLIPGHYEAGMKGALHYN